jgi:hypothetical protein
MDLFIFSSETATEEEVTRPIGRDRAKSTTRKGKGNEGSSSQSESSFRMGGIISTLKKLSTIFTKAQMWKKYNKLRNCSTMNMDTEELASHRETIRLIEIDLHFTTRNTVEV